jgi:hypothetical protein
MAFWVLKIPVTISEISCPYLQNEFCHLEYQQENEIERFQERRRPTLAWK